MIFENQIQNILSIKQYLKRVKKDIKSKLIVDYEDKFEKYKV